MALPRVAGQIPGTRQTPDAIKAARRCPWGAPRQQLFSGGGASGHEHDLGRTFPALSADGVVPSTRAVHLAATNPIVNGECGTVLGIALSLQVGQVLAQLMEGGVDDGAGS